MKSYITYCGEKFDVCFECTCSLSESLCDGKNNVMLYCHISKEGKSVKIDAWKLSKSEGDCLLYCIKVPYIRKNRIKVECSLSEYDSPVRCDFGFANERKEIITYKNITVTKMMSPKYAVKRLKALQKAKLVDNVVSDSVNGYDITCLACHYDEDCIYSALSTVSFGRVFESFDENLDDVNYPKYFIYDRKRYWKFPHAEWYHIKWYDEDEYELIREWYKPKNIEWTDSLLYENIKDFELSFLGFSKKPKYEELYEFVGNLSSDFIKDGCLSLNLLRWNDSYPPFDILWNKYCTQEIIDSNVYVRGGGWKDLRNDNIYAIDKGIENHCKKVVTLGFCNEPKHGSCECPVCREIYDIFSSTDKVIPLKYRIKRF